ncbi:unnamed protein product [Musa acuminata subsp. malaccensis]|uniref:(wild Malaysian banana) hypothetical protein n=1 Tax=Musa acuminata subsp. malaccensis TaxID=214687 RepID=A0A804JNP8_MUSAM|nr:unnamed protein product [Musa acuminata subsp. malaccensis]
MTYPTSLRGSRNDTFATHVSHARLFLLLCPLSLSLSLSSSLSPLDIKVMPLHRFSQSLSLSTSGHGCRNRSLPQVSMAPLLRGRHSALFWKSRPSRLRAVEKGRRTAGTDCFIGGLQWATSESKTQSQTMSKPMLRPRPRPKTKPHP